jgi:hypothetical protein
MPAQLAQDALQKLVGDIRRRRHGFRLHLLVIALREHDQRLQGVFGFHRQHGQSLLFL